MNQRSKFLQAAGIDVPFGRSEFYLADLSGYRAVLILSRRDRGSGRTELFPEATLRVVVFTSEGDGPEFTLDRWHGDRKSLRQADEWFDATGAQLVADGAVLLASEAHEDGPFQLHPAGVTLVASITE